MTRFVDFVFDGPPGPVSGRFVEVEDEKGRSVQVGEWVDSGDGFWRLRVHKITPLVEETGAVGFPYKAGDAVVLAAPHNPTVSGVRVGAFGRVLGVRPADGRVQVRWATQGGDSVAVWQDAGIVEHLSPLAAEMQPAAPSRIEETGEAEACVKVAHHLLVEQAEEIGHLRAEVARLRSAEETGEGEGWRQERPQRRDDYMDTYRDFWADLVEVDGQLDRDKVARELSDFSHVLDQYPLVLDELTNGRMSKTTYWARDIIAEVRDCQERDTEEAIAEARAEWIVEVAQLRSAGDGPAEPSAKGCSAENGAVCANASAMDRLLGHCETDLAAARAEIDNLRDQLDEARTIAEGRTSWGRSAGDGAADVEPTQEQVSAWLCERFGPDRDLRAQFHKLISEVGELSDAILGRHEGFPPPSEGWDQNLRDEAADVVLTVMAIAVTEKFDLAEAVASKWSRRKRGSVVDR